MTVDPKWIANTVRLVREGERIYGPHSYISDGLTGSVRVCWKPWPELVLGPGDAAALRAALAEPEHPQHPQERQVRSMMAEAGLAPQAPAEERRCGTCANVNPRGECNEIEIRTTEHSGGYHVKPDGPLWDCRGWLERRG